MGDFIDEVWASRSDQIYNGADYSFVSCSIGSGVIPIYCNEILNGLLRSGDWDA